VTAAWKATRSEYFEHLEHPDVNAGSRVIEQVVSGGASVADVVLEVLGPSQVEVGRRWQANEWTVADEHAASAVTETALMSVGASLARRRDRGAVVLACAPGEWHTLPLRMVSEVLAEAGYHCHFLGPSIPAEHLRSYLERARPMALALSCSSPLSLEGACESIAVAHASAVPVVAGGRGFGPDAHRAGVAGADAWCDDLPTAVATLEAWRTGSFATFATASTVPAEGGSDEELITVRRTVIAALTARFPRLADYTAEQWARTREDIESILTFAYLAIRFRDERIFTDFAIWLNDVLTARHVPAIVFNESLIAVADALSVTRPLSSALVRRSAVRP
jgi:methanogenic corrinoid protein MtbC1